MGKKKIIKIFKIGISIYVIYVIILIILFNYISKNPIDSISITYLRQNIDIQNEYGESIHIGRNLLYKTKKNDSTIKRAYTIETEAGNIVVYVNLTKKEKGWKADSWEVIEEHG